MERRHIIEEPGSFLERAGEALAQTRVGRAMLAPERRRVEAAFATMREAFIDGPFVLPPQELLRQLREVDPFLLQDAMRDAGWSVLAGWGGDADLERELAIQHAERLWRYSFLNQWSIWTWTAWGLGERVTLKAEDDEADEVLQEFWKAKRNRMVLGDDRIQELSEQVLIGGERFFPFYISEVDGTARMRMFDTDEVKRIITDPEDKLTPWFYERQWQERVAAGAGKSSTQNRTVFYPDWSIFFADEEAGELTADECWQKLVERGEVSEADKRGDKEWSNSSVQEMEPFPEFGPCGTCGRTGSVIEDDGVGLWRCAACHSLVPVVGEWVIGEQVIEPESPGDSGVAVCVLHVAHNRKDKKSLRGWPIATTARHWDDAHTEFIEARFTVAAAKAALVRRYRLKGGSRGVKSVKSRVQTGLSAMAPSYDANPPPAPGSSEFVNTLMQVEDLSMRTGAGDAKQDGEMFAWAASTGYGLFPTSVGLDTSRWATAVEMDKVQEMQFDRYRRFWAAQWRYVGEIVLRAREKYDSAHQGGFGSYAIEVSMDTFSIVDFPAISNAIGEAVNNAMMPAVGANVMDRQAARAILAELWRLMLQALNVQKAADLTSDEAFKVDEEPEEPIPPAVVPPSFLPASPEGEVPPEVEELAAVVARNLGAGANPEAVAEFALATLLDLRSVKTISEG